MLEYITRVDAHREIDNKLTQQTKTRALSRRRPEVGIGIVGHHVTRRVKRRNVPPEPFYSLARGVSGDGFKRVAAAEARTVVPRSFTLATAKGTNE